MHRPLRAIPLLATLSLALVAAASAQGITVTASVDGDSVVVSWTQPEGYPDVFVDYIEVANDPTIDAQGFFPIDNLVDFFYFATPEDSTGQWRSDKPLQQGATYYVHVELYDQLENTTAWSTTVPFTVPAPAPSSPGPASQAPPEPSAPTSPIVPIASEQEPVVGHDYQVRVRRRGSTLVLSFRDRTQVDATPPAPYRVCWTRPIGVGCARRLYFDGAWDVVRLKVTKSVGRPRADKRVVRVTWRIGGHTVRHATLTVHPA